MHLLRQRQLRSLLGHAERTLLLLEGSALAPRLLGCFPRCLLPLALYDAWWSLRIVFDLGRRKAAGLDCSRLVDDESSDRRAILSRLQLERSEAVEDQRGRSCLPEHAATGRKRDDSSVVHAE
jgi:hypothetical protein